MSGRMYILVGNIASGKSTWVNEQINEHTIIVSNDTITNAVHGNNYKMYNPRLKPLYKMLETNMIYYGLSHGYKVIIDATNMNKSTRRRYIELAKSCDCEYIYCCLFKMEDISVHAKRRWESENRGYTYEEWLGVAERMFKQYEEPELSEGFKDILRC